MINYLINLFQKKKKKILKNTNKKNEHIPFSWKNFWVF
ncbi:hypothetical protein SRH_01330 [Mesomycoplasma hyorhinis MCLD]|uniref:Uncharacterized protein n=1 Tax=Mesomycoplasma hyorhinis (strain MCLD) TaxID=936139 RepID=A0ABM5M5C8_MESHM|nr:hypothetical protein SRH_01330 [Mesomycoplasma hyorhinis MCLD]